MRVLHTDCAHCGAEMDGGGPDECLGWIPGVSQACCGHGNKDSAYVYLGPSDGRYVLLKGDDALDFFEIVKMGELVEPGP